MVTIRFILSKENIIRAGQTEQKIIDFLHRFFVMERKATEIDQLGFRRDDDNAMCDFGDIISLFRRNPEFMGFFSKCGWDIDGEEEDILAEIKDYERRHHFRS